MPALPTATTEWIKNKGVQRATVRGRDDFRVATLNGLPAAPFRQR
jgi:hypothetical protein